MTTANGQATLATVTDPTEEIQVRADELVPIGWCNLCVAEAMEALSQGREPGIIHAGVTIIAVPSHLMVNGMAQLIPISAPACLIRHLAARKPSSLVPGG